MDNIPSATTFSFTAPFPSSSRRPTPSTTMPLKQRRVSLALPSSPRLVPAWSFRDDTGLESHVAETSGLAPEKRGKMRKIANDSDRDDPDLAPSQEKKQRKKWTTEETQMLVDGCNVVSMLQLRSRPPSPLIIMFFYYSTVSAAGRRYSATRISSSTLVLQWILKTGKYQFVWCFFFANCIRLAVFVHTFPTPISSTTPTQKHICPVKFDPLFLMDLPSSKRPGARSVGHLRKKKIVP